jgi:hypothetical protein
MQASSQAPNIAVRWLHIFKGASLTYTSATAAAAGAAQQQRSLTQAQVRSSSRCVATAVVGAQLRQPVDSSTCCAVGKGQLLQLPGQYTAAEMPPPAAQ